MSIIKLWKSRNQIIEGITNSVFKRDDVEAIAKERMNMCNSCEYIDHEGSKCYIPGTQPCCGHCGCKLGYKTRSLSSSCPINKWTAILTEQESDLLNEKLGL